MSLLPRARPLLVAASACAAIAFAATAPGCARESLPRPEVTPVGEAGMRVDEAVTFRLYDARRPPVLRTGIEPVGWRVVWRAGGAEVGVPFTVSHDAGFIFLDGRFDGSPPAGPGRLVVTDGSRVIGDWPVWWSLPAAVDRIAPVERLAGVFEARAPEAAVWLWRCAAWAHDRAGLPTEAARALRRGARVHERHGRLARARAMVDEAALLDARVGSARGLAYSTHARALLAHLAGELDAAERLSARAERLARAARLATLADYAAVWHATVLGELGEAARAGSMFDALTARSDGFRPDLRAMLATNRGWFSLRRLQRGATDVRPEQVADDFRLALSLQGDDPDDRANQHANLAALAQLTGDRAALGRHVAAHRAIDPERSLQHALFVDLLAGHELLLDGRAEDALARFDAVARRSEEGIGSGAGESLWQAEIGRARALRAAGRMADGLAADRRALAALDRTASRTALNRHRALFFATHDDIYGEAFAAALAAGDVPAAFAVADARRARVVRDLDLRARLGRLSPDQEKVWAAKLDRYLAARARFEASRDDIHGVAVSSRPQWQAHRRAERADLLRLFEDAHRWLDAAAPIAGGGATVGEVQARLGPDEALWLAHRAGARWHGFLVTPAAVRHRVGEGPLPALDRLPAETGHLMLVGVPPGAAASLWTRVSTASWSHAGALREAAPVEGPVVVIGDPDGTLPGAWAEAGHIAELLGGRSIRGADATRSAVRAGLAGAGMVHFSGHGVLEPASAWDAHLLLARGERLTLEDILMARFGPRLVVLDSCETGRAEPLAGDIAVSLADGFIAAGAGSVVASIRPVPDAATLRLMARFYAEGGRRTPARALRAAALAARAEGDALWDAFHLWGAR